MKNTVSRTMLVSALVLLPNIAFALSGTCPEGVNCNTNVDVNTVILSVINWMLSITLALDVLFLIIGGFFYITSAGNEERATKGKTTIVNAIIGLIIIIMSYGIAKMVERFFLQP